MTITSMPGPDRSIKTADLKKLVLFSKGDRNRRVGEFLKELDLAEARNTGYPVILNAVKTNGSPRPTLETNSHRDYFTFVLPIHKLFLKSDAEIVRELNPTDPVTDPVSDPVKCRVLKVLKALVDGPKTAAELREVLSVSHRKFFRDNYVNPLIRAGFIRPEDAVSPRSPRLKYFITPKGIKAEIDSRALDDESQRKDTGEHTEKSTVNDTDESTVKNCELTGSELKIVMLLRNNQSLTQGEIADALKITRNYVTKVMGRLKAREIIRRVGPDKGGHWEVLEAK